MRIAGTAGSAAPDTTPQVMLVDHNRNVGSDMGTSARPVIEGALTQLGVHTRLGVRVAAVGEDRVTLSTGEMLAASTVVWCAGMRANPMTADLGVERDRLGRVAVDDYLRVPGLAGVFAAGDVAAAQMDDTHISVLSCQHGRPMGRYAGYNVVSDLFGEPMLPLRIPWYVTVWTLEPRVRSTPKAGIGRSSPPGPKPKQPNEPSIARESIRPSMATETHSLPPPLQRCSTDPAPTVKRRTGPSWPA